MLRLHGLVRTAVIPLQGEMDAYDAAMDAAAAESLTSHRASLGAWEQEYAKLALRCQRDDTPTMATVTEDLSAFAALQSSSADTAAAARKEELHRHKHTMKALDALDTALSVMKADAIAKHDHFYAQVEALGEQLHAALTVHGDNLLLAVESHAVPSGVEEDVRSLAASRVTLTAALQAGHDSRLARVLRRVRCRGVKRGGRGCEGEGAGVCQRLKLVHQWLITASSVLNCGVGRILFPIPLPSIADAGHGGAQARGRILQGRGGEESAAGHGAEPATPAGDARLVGLLLIAVAGVASHAGRASGGRQGPAGCQGGTAVPIHRLHAPDVSPVVCRQRRCVSRQPTAG